MTDYVLEILDGDQAGDVVAFGGTRLAIGRRAGNDLVIHDEKCSGQHAEIAVEDGGVVLRDLGSTNGTTIDGRRIEEIALQPGDVFQVGRVRIRFRRADAPAGDDGGAGLEEPQWTRMDRAALARGRRRSPLLLIALLVVLVAAGGFLYFRQGLGGEAGPTGANALRPLRVAGNLLPDGIADFEGEDGWELQAELDAVPFQVAVGRRDAHTGSAALLAERTPPAEGESPGSFALARLVAPVTVGSERSVSVAAHVRTAGGARALVRLAFFSSAQLTAEEGESGGEALRRALRDDCWRTGTGATQADGGFERIEANLVAPRGIDRAVVELVALLPTDGARATFDDVAVVAGGQGQPSALLSQGGRRLTGVGATVRVDGAAGPVLLGVAPHGDGDAAVAALRARGLLVPSDLGYAFAGELLDGGIGFRLSFSGGGASGLELDFPPESASVRVAAGDAGFATVEPGFSAEEVREVVLGDGGARVALRFPGPTRIHGGAGNGAYRLTLFGALHFELVTEFGAERDAARALLREARIASEAGRDGDAIELLERLLATVPHDVDAVRDALQRRSALLAEQRREVEELFREGGESSFFQARVGYQRVLAGIDRVIERYGADRIARIDELRALADSMRAGVAQLDAVEGERHGALLRGLARAFELSGEDSLAARLRGYADDHYGPAPAGQTGDGQGGGGQDGDREGGR
ncbi:MAG: FHA domain-containing protein [Planctomycetes bacterium]|nr:FHA domain-containing protein [Planctomycetota bacterium]